MYLKHIEISGFRGINHLSLQLRPNMVLIGENAWGKSSLIDALSLIFNLEHKLYQFQFKDFHIQYSDTPNQVRDITLVFTFCEEIADDSSLLQLPPALSFCSFYLENKRCISLKVTGRLLAEQIGTEYQFVDQDLKPIHIEQAEKWIKQFIYHHPVFRLRDARLNKRVHNELLLNGYNQPDTDFQRELKALSSLLKYYFLTSQSRHLMKNSMQDTTLWWEKVKSLCLRLKQNEELVELVQQHISDLFLFKPKVAVIEKPIILFEDFNAFLHPRMVAIFWELLSVLPSQRITTTNSIELLSQVPLREIGRLVRYDSHTQAYWLERQSIGREDLRKLTFHIHHNRGLALFAKAWILVEGETEVWILEELAKLLEINLEMEGIKIVEFAQCGLRPLIKYARAMGIEWYVLTDGDDAGKRYAETVKSLDDDFAQRLTALPQKDIEHFFYKAGLRNVFIRLANWRSQEKYPVSYIIKRAIQKSSKPDLAIALANEMRNRGEHSVPPLFKKLFADVLALVRK
ncbi:ATP-dependent endonuclease [Mannheimia bovis]|uniref:ATP-dependent nuclease n=1 Tax=Mannheimia bovis TaxID=2770636 RepID=UPI0024B6D110|nr:ATP-dependent endonuclease [Mannheimia bovis]WHP46170.1 ATP-dependent endonuclease [Mannheimia bovis]